MVDDDDGLGAQAAGSGGWMKRDQSIIVWDMGCGPVQPGLGRILGC